MPEDRLNMVELIYGQSDEDAVAVFDSCYDKYIYEIYHCYGR